MQNIDSNVPAHHEQLTDWNNEHQFPRNVGKVNYDLFHSYLGQFTFLGIAALSTAMLTAVFIAPVTSPVIPICCIVGSVALLILKIVKERKKLLFEISLIYTIITGGHDWCTPITKNIILGALPLENHMGMFRGLKVTNVINMVEEFEKQPGLVTPLSKTDLEIMKISSFDLSAPDFIGVPVEAIHKGVEHMHQEITEKPDALFYIHCKAGRGRSATLVVCYLLKYGVDGRAFANFEEAYGFVKEKRPKINLNPNQQASINAYHEQYC